MARKRTKSFGWVREDLADDASFAAPLVDPDAESPYRPSPAEHRAHMIDLRGLANRLAELPVARRRVLPLPEDVQEALDVLAGLGHTPARRRQVHRVKGLLSHVDAEALEAAIDGDGPQEARFREAERWRTRLLSGGDEALGAWLDLHPGTDRQSLRAALRTAAEPTDAGTRAQRRVLDLLREVLVEPED